MANRIEIQELLAVILAAVLIARATVSESLAGEPRPQDLLAPLQKRLGTENQVCVKMTLVAYAGMMGGMAKQPPINLTIARRKPDFYYVYEAPSSDDPRNPACWYQLEGGQLLALEYWAHWPGREPRGPRARGVRVTNFAKVAGDKPEAAFRLAKDRTGSFAFIGSSGAEMLEVFEEANPKAMSVEKRDSGWRLRERATDFKSSLVRESLYDDKSSAFVVVDVATGEQPLKRIAIYPDVKKYPDLAAIEVSLRDIAFRFDRKDLPPPKHAEVIKSVEVKSPDKINSEIIAVIRPVPVKDTGVGTAADRH